MTPDLPAAALSEPRAREIVLVQAFDQNLGPLWTAEDRAWASRLALETAGTAAAPAQFLAERARNALQRLAPRDAAVRRWLDKPAWRQRWIVAALAAGLLLGLALDSLGGSQRINLLAPPVWGTIAWNLLVYFSLLWGWLGPACPPLHVLRRTLGRWLWPTSAASGPLQQAQAAWRAHAAPLTAARAMGRTRSRRG